MRHFVPTLLAMLALTACSSDSASTPAVPAADGGSESGLEPDAGRDARPPRPDSAAAEAGTPTGVENKVYVQFVMNTHDWVFLDDSIATLNRVIDLHEQYKFPVEVYLTDPMIQKYVDKSPALVARLKTSPFVAVSHHVRPPAPYYSSYDWYGLDKLSDTDLRSLLLSYEEHAIDLSTGQPGTAEGGYEFLKKTIGYAPYVVTMAAGPGRVASSLAAIYKEKGAQFTLTHNEKGTAWGETSNGLPLRPETVEVKVYERKDDIDFATQILKPAMDSVGQTRPAWVNLKWHEDNFYTSGTPWGNVYYSDAQAKTMKPPPYDVAAYEPVKKKSETEKATQWKRYEAALSYMATHRDDYVVIGVRDLVRFMGK